MQTVAESSEYTRTSTHAEVQAFCQALAAGSSLCRYDSIGTSGEGQEITALIVSDRQCFSSAKAKQQNKVVVVIEANIHAGEVEGKEASLALIRDLVMSTEGKTLFAKICLVLVPNFNPDGNDRISVKNRALDIANLEGQVNPEHGVGTRYTGQGWNLNRDNMKQEAPETKAMAKTFLEFWPHLFIDCHTTDGSLHRYDLTYDCPRGNEPIFAPVRTLNRRMLDDVAAAVLKKNRFSSQWYGNFVKEENPGLGWHTYPALPRFGSHYRGLHGRLDVLLETYSYIPYERRCQVTRAWLHELLRFAAKNAKELRDTVDEHEAARIEIAERVEPSNSVALAHGIRTRGPKGELLFEYPAYAFDAETVVIASFDTESLKARRYPGKKKIAYTIPHLRGFVPTSQVRLPYAYLAPAELADRLGAHGIEFQHLDAELSMSLESYIVIAIEQTFSPDVAAAVPKKGEAEVPLSKKQPPQRFETVLTVHAERRQHTAPKGTLFIKTAQRSGILAAYLLEPTSEDGFARWQFLDHLVKVGKEYPIHRVVDHITPRVRPE